MIGPQKPVRRPGSSVTAREVCREPARPVPLGPSPGSGSGDHTSTAVAARASRFIQCVRREFGFRAASCARPARRASAILRLGCAGRERARVGQVAECRSPPTTAPTTQPPHHICASPAPRRHSAAVTTFAGTAPSITAPPSQPLPGRGPLHTRGRSTDPSVHQQGDSTAATRASRALCSLDRDPMGEQGWVGSLPVG